MDIKIFDLHTDLLTFGFCDEVTVDLINKENDDGNIMCLALFTPDAKGDISCYKNKCDKNRFCIEDCTNVNIKDLVNQKPFYASLTWNFNNEFAGGALEDGEITCGGISAIDEFNKNGIILDLAHIGNKSFFKAIDKAEKVMISHACCNTVRTHYRNFTDEQIRLVLEKNGIMGICFVSEFLCENKKADVFDVAKHIDYFCNKFSHKNLAIGTDFYGTKNGVKGIDRYSDFNKLYDELSRLGYSRNSIQDIFFNNARAFHF